MEKKLLGKRTTCMDIIKMLIFLDILLCTLSVSSTIEWNIESEYMVIDEDVMLACNVTSCSTKSIKKWIGGQDYKVLCFGNVTTHPSKYALMSDDTSQHFNLMIKNVTFVDFEYKYTCACGLQQHTKKLDLDALNFIYPPQNVTKTNVGYFLDIQIEVYPLPTCYILSKNDVTAVNYTYVFKSVPNKENDDYRPQLCMVNISHSLRDIANIDCRGHLDVYCQVGPLNCTILHHRYDLCKSETYENIAIMYPVTVIITLMAIIAAGYVCINRSHSERNIKTSFKKKCCLICFMERNKRKMTQGNYFISVTLKHEESTF